MITGCFTPNSDYLNTMTIVIVESIWPKSKHVTRGHTQGGKTFLYKYFGGAKALFCYANHQVSGSRRGAKPFKIFH